MAYADQQEMSTGKIAIIAFVLIFHVLLLWAVANGLAYEAVKKVAERLEAQEIIEDEPPPEEEPPPEPEPIQEIQPPPIDTFTPPVTVPNPNPTPRPDPVPEPTPTKTCPDGSVVPRNAACPEQDPVVSCPGNTVAPNGSKQVRRSQLGTCKAPRPDLSKAATPRNNRGRWVTTNDYPSRSLQRDEEGTSRIRLTVGTNGKVTNCTASGATAALDAAACKFAKRRARFRPALDRDGNPTTGSYSTSVRWQIPK